MLESGPVCEVRSSRSSSHLNRRLAFGECRSQTIIVDAKYSKTRYLMQCFSSSSAYQGQRGFIYEAFGEACSYPPLFDDEKHAAMDESTLLTLNPLELAEVRVALTPKSGQCYRTPALSLTSE